MPNRLADSHSPYLLQHAGNPVDWYPWSDEAFERARAEDRPVFLSIGYATCHWCHVMERESFEDAEVARLLNDHFVAVKVDREERPDVDSLYMTVCQALNGHGGWPLTLLLTPDKRPFFAGTYLPKHGRGGRPGMMELLPQIATAWAEQRERVEASAEAITNAVREGLDRQQAGETLEARVLTDAYNALAARFDAEHAGFGAAPKFPTPHNLLFLLREHVRLGPGDASSKRARWMAEETLRTMRLGGIYDHVGFGFHRYSTDRYWLLPHFEKMLYDQALLAMAYTEAWALTREPLLRQTAEEIFEYVRRDLTSPGGAFFSAEDADSLNEAGEKEEGAFYVWRFDELIEALGEDGSLAAALFGAEREGNFRDEATREKTGANVLHRTLTTAEAAERLEMDPAALRDQLERIRRRLFEVRQQRPRPLLDDKVLTDWNGLMIAALAKAAWTFDAPEYAERAARAATFLLEHLKTDADRLLHRYRKSTPAQAGGHAGLQANLDDYAFFVWGLIELYQATFEERWLREALALNRTMLRHFRDEATGGLFFTPDDGEALLVRQKEYYDGAVPSGNSVAMLNNLRLGRLTGDTELEDIAEQIGRSSQEVRQHPIAHTMLMTAVQMAVGPAQEITVTGEPEAEDTRALLGVLRAHYLPNAVIHLRPPEGGAVAALAPYTASQAMQDGRATAYVCERFACQQPVTDPEALRQQLEAIAAR